MFEYVPATNCICFLRLENRKKLFHLTASPTVAWGLKEFFASVTKLFSRQLEAFICLRDASLEK